ncbi:MAG: pyridoxal-dependent decarboxylase [Planctomycetota bacterium]|nr:pyridoxal-dependent decarboxylase [Planctomycetota bacterium]
MRDYLMSDDLAEGFRAAAEVAIDTIRGLPDRKPVSPGSPDEELDQLFREGIGEEGIGLKEAVAEFREKLAPRFMATPHPLYLGLVNSSPLPGGIIGDLFISMFNNNAGAAEQGPAAASAERAVIGFLCKQLGLEGGTGLIVPGGAIANLTALIAARDRALPMWRESGPLALPGDPVFYASDAGHFSLQRAGQALGAGDRSLHLVPTTNRGEMDPTELEKLIRVDRRAGRAPFCIVGTAGTTTTGAFDPLDKIADVAESRGLWFHVDAAYGGAVSLSEKHRHLLKGIERADSVTIDPHKWFFIPMTAGAVLVRNGEDLLKSFDSTPSYIPTDTEHPDPFRLSFACSRRASALKVWLAWRAHGLRVVREAVERNIELTRYLEERLRKDGFEILPDGPISIACARDVPVGMSDEQLDKRQQDLARAVVRSGVAWFATVMHDEKTWLRFNMVNLYTAREDIDRLVDSLLACRQDLR